MMLYKGPFILLDEGIFCFCRMAFFLSVKRGFG
jgi:hypothetical protein